MSERGNVGASSVEWVGLVDRLEVEGEEAS